MTGTSPLGEYSRKTPLVLAAWFALAGGAFEGTLAFIRRDLMHRTLHLSRDAVWLPAVANLVFVAFPAVLLALLWNRLPRERAFRSAVFVPAAIAGTGIGLFWGRIHWAAGLLIGVGLGVQFARIIASKPETWIPRLARTCPLLATAVAMAAVLVHGGKALREHRAMADMPTAPSGVPNVVLLVLDTARWFDFGLAGDHRQVTPAIDSRAREGTLFTRAFSGSSWTLPGHATMLTGRWPVELRVDWRVPLDRSFPTLAEELTHGGIVTAGFVANNTYCSYEHGLDRGFVHYEDYPLDFGTMLASSAVGRRLSESQWARRLTGYYQILGRKNAAEVNRQFLRWLDGSKGRPFFAMLNYFDAHEPYLPPDGWDKFNPAVPRKLDELYYVTGMATLPFKEARPEAEMEREHDAYDGALSYLDHQIGILIDELERRGVLENTLLIITADHGEQFGEHNLFEHGNSLYSSVTHVPLLVRWPGHVPSGLQVSSWVSTRDIPATVLGIYRLGSPGIPGRSLLRFLPPDTNAARSLEDPVFMDFRTEQGQPERAIIAAGWKLLLRRDGSEELYDLQHDSKEAINLSGQPADTAIRTQLRRTLDSIATPGRRGTGPVTPRGSTSSP